MIFIRDTQLQRSASIVLFLYAGAFLGQADVCFIGRIWKPVWSALSATLPLPW